MLRTKLVTPQASLLPLLTNAAVPLAPPKESSWIVTFWQMAVGGVTSLTVTLKLHVAVLPLASVLRKAMVVVPTGKVAPLGRPEVITLPTPEQLSVPTGLV